MKSKKIKIKPVIFIYLVIGIFLVSYIAGILPFGLFLSLGIYFGLYLIVIKQRKTVKILTDLIIINFLIVYENLFQLIKRKLMPVSRSLLFLKFLIFLDYKLPNFVYSVLLFLSVKLPRKARRAVKLILKITVYFILDLLDLAYSVVTALINLFEIFISEFRLIINKLTAVYLSKKAALARFAGIAVFVLIILFFFIGIKPGEESIKIVGAVGEACAYETDCALCENCVGSICTYVGNGLADILGTFQCNGTTGCSATSGDYCRCDGAGICLTNNNGECTANAQCFNWCDAENTANEGLKGLESDNLVCFSGAACVGGLVKCGSHDGDCQYDPGADENCDDYSEGSTISIGDPGYPGYCDANCGYSPTEIYKFYVKNSTNDNVASFDDAGNVVIKGTLSESLSEGAYVSDTFINESMIASKTNLSVSDGSVEMETEVGEIVKQNYTSSGTYYFTVPSGVTNITVKVWGAGGGGGGGGTVGGGGEGGGGGFARSDLSVTPGENLTIEVGGGGVDGDFSTGTGGAWSGDGGGGGGHSEILRSATPLLIAPGGGGGGGGDNSAATEGGDGGAGGGTTGTTGSASSTALGGGGGTQSAGGGGGTGGANPGSAGGSQSGGAGADGRNAAGVDGSKDNGGVTSGGDGGIGDVAAGFAAGGGGGSGYYGGGGGSGSASANAGGGGGGGGSVYITGTNTINTSGSGQNAGNNGDSDYGGSAGYGENGGGTSSSGTTGKNGLVVIIYNSVNYKNQGELWSTNLLSGGSIESINSFGYNVSSIPAGTNLSVQFSQDNSTWKNSTGATDGWNVLSSGSNQIDLSSLGWSGANFYYKMQFTSDGTDTPVLDSININYDVSPSGNNNFIIQNSTGDWVAWIDGATGNMYLAGTMLDGQAISPPANSFIIQNSSGHNVSYIDSSGNLRLSGAFVAGGTP